MNSRIDDNDIKTWIAYNETTGLPDRVCVDPVTGAVLIYNVSNLSAPTVPSRNDAQRDGNDSPTALGYDDVTGKTECFRCDTGGNLIIIPQ